MSLWLVIPMAGACAFVALLVWMDGRKANSAEIHGMKRNRKAGTLI